MKTIRVIGFTGNIRLPLMEYTFGSDVAFDDTFERLQQNLKESAQNDSRWLYHDGKLVKIDKLDKVAIIT